MPPRSRDDEGTRIDGREGKHLDTSDRAAATREEGESAGWIQPLDPGFQEVQARSVPGHAVGGPTGHIQAEEVPVERGTPGLAGPWPPVPGEPPGHEDLSIPEVSAHGNALADAMITKALVRCEPFTVPGPDADGLPAPATRP